MLRRKAKGETPPCQCHAGRAMLCYCSTSPSISPCSVSHVRISVLHIFLSPILPPMSHPIPSLHIPFPSPNQQKHHHVSADKKKTLHQCQPPQDRGGHRHRNVFARGPRPPHSDVVNPPKTYHRQWYKRMVTLSPRRRPSQTRSLDPLLHPSRHRDPRPRPGVATRW